MNNILLSINITLMYSAPLILAALGGIISERSGVVNIGLEGMMTIGALVGAVIAYYTQNPWLGFICAGLAGCALAFLHAIASIKFKADQTISGLAMNFIGPGLSLFICKALFGGTNTSPTVTNKIPKILSWMQNPNKNIWTSNLNVDSTILIALLLTFAMWYFLYKTKLGLRVISVGENPKAAATLGINVHKVRYFCVLASGFLAGIGGASCSLAIISVFSPTVISGKGFIALAAVIFGKWTPQGALGACLLFGFAQSLVVLLGGNESIIPSQFLSMLPYILTIIVLVLFVGKSVGPKASGEPF